MEQLKHECGIAMIRLLKPLSYYKEKYGTQNFALERLYLMMEKQHNRGQEGAGIACVKMNETPGHEYMFRERAEGKDAITKVFASAYNQIENPTSDDPCSTPFQGELYMGHLRYSTTGKSGLTFVHPFMRRNNWKAKNLCLCGNFNMTNIEEVFNFLTEQGQCPRIYGDSYIALELMGHRLDREVERLFGIAERAGLRGRDITYYIDGHVEIANVLKSSLPLFDGGYVMCGLTGSGEFFASRDPWGIRPAFYYADEEFVVVASERPVLQTTFNLECDQVQELTPGQALIVNSHGELKFEQIREPKEYAACSFERIYFSRGNDKDIYQERKALGHQLAGKIAEAVEGDLENTVVSYIPNTAEVAYVGMCAGLKEIQPNIRCEKIVSKDIKLRTFITAGSARNDLAAHVYDITTGVVRPNRDNLVVIDDSIVRGTTLRESIIKILDRLHPKKIIICSSAPQIRYPDYYGIDMSTLDGFIAFQACVALLVERGMWMELERVYQECKKELKKPLEEIGNPVRELYAHFTAEDLNRKMVELLRPAGVRTPIELIFQSIEGLHEAIPNHPGDWYFTGNYPTPGGNRMVNLAYCSYYEHRK